jgi:hypothetical protein
VCPGNFIDGASFNSPTEVTRFVAEIACHPDWDHFLLHLLKTETEEYDPKKAENHRAQKGLIDIKRAKMVGFRSCICLYTNLKNLYNVFNTYIYIFVLLVVL